MSGGRGFEKQENLGQQPSHVHGWRRQLALYWLAAVTCGGNIAPIFLSKLYMYVSVVC